ncbi:hypothetical protein F66182_7398 [Fusarium sp. NRRL 66182]|nr:hypothetical protein F66182_7398 [Fusarium sp. NRRL 66182]
MPQTKSSRHSKTQKSKSHKDSKEIRSRKSKSRSKTSTSKSEKRSGRRDNRALVDVYCAIYNPHLGNYYHWALAINHQTTRGWLLFEVIQDVHDGPFEAVMRETNPASSASCHQPLLLIGQIDAEWTNTLVTAIGEIQVPGEGLSWNCQDYVLEIWRVMLNYGMITHHTWQDGHNAMLPYYGQDFGEQNQDQEDERDEEYEDSSEEHDGEFPSAEFVYDSDSY